jgi:hypothetical protein
LSHDERRGVNRLLGPIQRDPSVVGVNKITLMPNAPFTTYLGSDFFVFYYLDGSTIIVVDVERA